jgi:hypothetical protein
MDFSSEFRRLPERTWKESLQPPPHLIEALEGRKAITVVSAPQPASAETYPSIATSNGYKLEAEQTKFL